MNKYNKITPLGFRDLLFEESVAENEIMSRLMKLFSQRGFHEVVTPTLEFLDVFSLPSSVMPPEQMYKLIDNHGRLMTLRPDITMPIARLVATRLKGHVKPIRLCYTEKVYRVNENFSGRRDEVTQSGVELLGASGKRADLEILAMAVEALRRCGASDFKIEIGHAGLFKALTSKLDENAETIEVIRSLIETKSYAALDDALLKLENKNIAEILKRLPHLFGGIEVLDEAKELCGDMLGGSLEYLREIYDDLKELGLENNIYLDLGLVHRNTYYTGLLFRGYIAGSGITVLSGGRYDELLKEFGVNMNAIGFAVENDAMAEILLSSGQIGEIKSPDVLVFGEDGFEMKAIAYCNKLADSGVKTEYSIFKSEQESAEYAKNRGIKKLVVVGNENREVKI